MDNLIVDDADGVRLITFNRPEKLNAFDSALYNASGAALESIPGMPPRLDTGPFGECTFAPRCRYVHDACRVAEPALVAVSPNRLKRCILPPERLA